ncbi:hypothetical protein DL764_003229 [Monosporascus ibericus]|uniref:Uncharacterized protein n=1 Tax=Monosporascus ibericus TaxID=155417 RepID=A0A4Q4TJ13_9PEZI|nr:hypothetical protein DL764_003229 [Monosporascus ibericus]
MKSTSIAFGLLSGLASAEYHHPRHFHTFYARNATTAYPSTTLTVEVTQVHTITSCAPTITNCPIKNGTEAVVTEVVDLTTTVCPVTEAEGIASSVIGDHSSGKITGKTSTLTTTPAPGTTGDVSPTTEGVVNYPTQDVPSPTGENTGGVVVSQTTGVVEETLSVTVGPESSKSVLVTTVRSTYTSQITVTMPPPGADYPDAGTSVEDTTTITSTSTGTRTVTVPGETETASPEGPETSDEGSSEGSDGGACECPPATTVTVTETMPASTVYVTAPVPTSTSTGVKAVTEEPYPTGTVPSEEDDEDVTPAPEDGEDAEGDKDAEDGEDADECPEQEEVVEGEEDGEEEVVEVTATVVPVPYPTAGPSGNGTVPTSSTYSAIVSSSVDVSPTGSSSAGVSPSSSTSATEGVPTYPGMPVSSSTMSASSSAVVSSSTAVSPNSSATVSSSTQGTTSTPEPVADYPTYPTYPAVPARK